MSRRGGSALVTVLFTDIVGSTEIASELGNRRWRELLSRHHHLVRRELRRHGGREIDTAGDGFFATFDRPAQGIRCAWAVTEAVRSLGIEVRAGLHVGEAELMGRQVGGVAVHVGARIGAQAGPGEVLVSGTLRDLVPGTGLQFEDRGWRELKGVAEPQRLNAVEAVDGEPRTAPLPAGEAARRRAQIVPSQPLRRTGVLAAVAIVVVVAVVAAFLLLGSDKEPGRPKPVENAVIRLDAVTGKTETLSRLPLDTRLGTFHPLDLQVGEGAVWVTAGRCLCRVNLATGKVRTVFSRSLALTFDHMALGLRAIWLSGLHPTGRPSLIGIDPVTLQPDVESEPLEAENVFGASVATAAGSVWLGFRGQLVKFDPHTGKPLDEFALDVTVDGLVSTGNDLWIIDSLAQSLFRFDTARGAIKDSVELAGSPDEVVAEPDGTLWILDELGGTLTRVDPTGEPDAPFNVGTEPVDVAAGSGGVWVADQETVKEVDPVTLEVRRTIELPGEPAQIGVDPRNGDLWVYFA